MVVKEVQHDDLSVSLLKQIDWDFNQSAKSKTIHSIHPYPAKFISEIPSDAQTM